MAARPLPAASSQPARLIRQCLLQRGTVHLAINRLQPSPAESRSWTHLSCLYAAATGSRRHHSTGATVPPSEPGERPWPTVLWLSGLLDTAGAAYFYQGAAAAWIQGVYLRSGAPPADISVCVQWDFLSGLHGTLKNVGCNAGNRVSIPGGEQFSFAHAGNTITVGCQFNAVVAMDTSRVAYAPPVASGQSLWVQSLHAERESADPQLAAAVTARLAQLQDSLSSVNDKAWTTQDTYAAWLQRFGPPAEAAARILRDPTARLAPLHLYTGTLQGAKVASLFGSHGTKAVAMALLGADVTVYDLSAGNAQYAQELAAAAGVPLHYVVADVLKLPKEQLSGTFDAVVMELGVLHYLIDLQPLMQAVVQLLAPGGRLVLREFHPVSTKLITSKGRKHKVTGNYFSQDLWHTSVAHSKHTHTASKQVPGPVSTQHLAQPQLQPHDAPGVQLRQWTLGEVVTAVASAGLTVTRLVEEPGVKLDDAGLPKLYTIVAFLHKH